MAVKASFFEGLKFFFSCYISTAATTLEDSFKGELFAAPSCFIWQTAAFLNLLKQTFANLVLI